MISKKNKYLLIAIGCLLLLCYLFVAVEIVTRLNYAKEYRIQAALEEQELLQELSEKTGMQFDDWQSLREYVYCGDLLKKGMTQKQVEETLSSIGEIRIGPYNISFKNEDLFYNLSPMSFSYVDGKLDSWWRVTGEFTIGENPMESCEIP